MGNPEDGGVTQCFQNRYGIAAKDGGGGSYPGTHENDIAGITTYDTCMFIGVLKPGNSADGFTKP